jgi:hypothetical protein
MKVVGLIALFALMFFVLLGSESEPPPGEMEIAAQ